MSKFRNGLRFLGYLVSFESAARLGSFTLAAQALGISRTAISYQIKEMERELETPLFYRLNRSVKLTPEGEKLYVAATNSMQDLLDVALSIRNSKSPSRVIVTTTTGFANFWILPRIASFRETYPDIELKLVVSDDYINLEEEAIDVAVRYFSSEQSDPGSQFLLNHSIAPTCGAKLNTPLNQESSARDLLGERLIYLEGARYDQRSKWKTWFKTQGVHLSKLPNGISVNDYVNLIRICEAGEGWALLGSPLIDPQLASGVLRQPLQIPQMMIGTFSIKRNQARQNVRPVEVFCEWLVREVAAHPTSKENAILRAVLG